MIPIVITPGEALDRLSILKIKRARGPKQWNDQLDRNIEQLQTSIAAHCDMAAVEAHLQSLLDINSRLWKLEDQIHAKYLSDECAGAVGRSIAVVNGERSLAKRKVDEWLNAEPELKKYGSKASD